MYRAIENLGRNLHLMKKRAYTASSSYDVTKNITRCSTGLMTEPLFSSSLVKLRECIDVDHPPSIALDGNARL
jgi:hypothetical protein